MIEHIIFSQRAAVLNMARRSNSSGTTSPRAGSPPPLSRAATADALKQLNQVVSDISSPKGSMLSSVAVQLGGDNHPYKFSRSEPEYVVLLSSSAAAIAADAAKLGIRCWDNNNRQIVKEELAARVYAVHKKTMKDPDWFEPTLWGRNAGEYWKPKILGFTKGLFILCNMFAVNYGRAYYARAWNCHWPTITNLGGILDTPFCAGLKWVDSIWNGLQQSFVYGGAAAVAYAIPTMLGWRGEPTRQIY